MLHYLNPAINEWLPHSSTTIHDWVLRKYTEEKVIIRQAVQAALTNIHFTVDLWTSPNSLAILGIVAHYISATGNLDTSVLALREVNGEHSGENQAVEILDVINDYGIASKVGYFVMDNATNNDTMIKELSKKLKEKHEIIWDPRPHRLRCNGHVINLAVQAFLFASDEEDISQDNNTELLSSPTEIEMEQWRKKGPLGKLHNIVVYIQRSPQRIASFKLMSNNLCLLRDNSTRWNSWYSMLQRALRVQHAIELFCVKFKENENDLRKYIFMSLKFNCLLIFK
jgi:hypothetical protein